MEKDSFQTIKEPEAIARSRRKSQASMGSSSSKGLSSSKGFWWLYLEMMSFEPLSNMLPSLIEDGVGFPIEDPGVNVRRLRSRDLKSVQFLGQGLSGFIYETAWSTWFGKKKLGRFARKDFPGVESEVFEREAARLINLNHRNLVKTFGWTVDRLGCSLVSEFVSNDLQSVVEMRREASSMGFHLEPPFKIAEAIYIMLHIARAMEFLHLMGVSHGDLRSNNVLVDLEADPMIVKVADFGLVKSKQRTTLVSQRARFLATFDWKAPETFPCSFGYTLDEFDWDELDFVPAMTPADADESSDVYSFAITCAYIMGGRLPFSENPEWILTELRGMSAGTVRPEIPFACPALLRELLELSWDSDPKRRPRFHQLREGLEILHQQETTQRGAKFSGCLGVMQPMKTKSECLRGVSESGLPRVDYQTREPRSC